MPAYRIPPLTGVGEGGDTETLAGFYEWAAECEGIARRPPPEADLDSIPPIRMKWGEARGMRSDTTA